MGFGDFITKVTQAAGEVGREVGDRVVGAAIGGGQSNYDIRNPWDSNYGQASVWTGNTTNMVDGRAQPAPYPSYTLDASSGAYGGGGGGEATYVDPYAKYGGLDAYNRLVSGFQDKESNVMSGARGQIDDYGREYNRGIMDFLDSQKIGQDKLDTQAWRTELAKMQGARGIQSMVGQGIRSAGTMLSNKNASDSSAAQAIAQAYGKIGQGEMANVGNQYAMGMDDYKTAQKTFDLQEASGIRNMIGSKDDSVNDIVNEVSDKLAAIDLQIQDADLPTRIALDQRKTEIKAHAKSALQALDKKLTDDAGAINPMDEGARLSKAGEMGRAGLSLGADAFQYSTDAPTSWQGGSPSGSSFPLYTMPRGRRQG